MFLLDFFQRLGRKCGRPTKKLDIIFGRLLLRGSNAKKWGDHKKKKFFKNNSVENVISFK